MNFFDTAMVEDRCVRDEYTISNPINVSQSESFHPWSVTLTVNQSEAFQALASIRVFAENLVGLGFL